MEYYQTLRKYVGHQPIILPGSVVIIVNEQKNILLQQRLDGKWGLPGGLMDLGESFEQVACREVFEETGLTIHHYKLLGIFSGEEYFCRLSNGHEFYSVTAVFITKDVTGCLKSNNESISLQYFPSSNLPINMKLEYRRFIEPFMEEIMK